MTPHVLSEGILSYLRPSYQSSPTSSGSFSITRVLPSVTGPSTSCPCHQKFFVQKFPLKLFASQCLGPFVNLTILLCNNCWKSQGETTFSVLMDLYRDPWVRTTGPVNGETLVSGDEKGRPPRRGFKSKTTLDRPPEKMYSPRERLESEDTKVPNVHSLWTEKVYWGHL